MSKSTTPNRKIRHDLGVALAVGAGVVAGSSAWLACGSQSFDGSQADSGDQTTGCGSTIDPKDNPACVDDTLGLFVSATSGDDANPGTKASPLKTITAAISKADAQRNRVYICSGTYPETVKLTVTTSLFGGFSCTDWSYAGSQGSVVPKVVPRTPGFALDVENVNGPVFIEDLEVDAPAAQNPGGSSIAVFVSSSSGPVTFRRVTAIAKDGNTGAAAAASSNYDPVAFPLGGHMADHNDGGLAEDCTAACVEGTGSTGGAGGATAQSGQPGGPAIPENPAGHNGGGGIAPGTTSCFGTTAFGSAGANAVAATGGAVGAQSPGHASAAGWVGSYGSPGAGGAVAQGGGGGAGLPNGGGSFNGAGGGGCGGCGGAGGSGGGSGGSSFAMLFFQSTVTVDICTLQVGSGGDGQQGGAGQIGETGGGGGAPAIGGGVGCGGGTGGKGGDGAGGGGGAGGNAIAIAYVGTQPTLNGGSQTEGHAGAGAAGGTGNSANNGTAGAGGTKSDIGELP